MEFRKDVTLGMERPLDPPLFNGGGCCKTVEHVRELSKSLAGAVLVGSMTTEARSGNSGNVWWVGSGVALNSLGMPNGGADYLKQNLREMVRITHDAGKPLIVNVAGFSPDEYGQLAVLVLEHGADAVELNLGCPNVIREDGSRKPIPSYDLDAFNTILGTVQSYIGQTSAAVWVKVSPNPMGDMIKRLAESVATFGFVKAITAVNTFPNSYAVDDSGKSRISVGLAGLSGLALKHIGLGQVLQWRQVLPDYIKVIGVGGISSGNDVRDYQTVGAEAFQMTTELLRSGDLNAYAFEHVAMEYDEVSA